jgi:hypothetical protein
MGKKYISHLRKRMRNLGIDQMKWTEQCPVDAHGPYELSICYKEVKSEGEIFTGGGWEMYRVRDIFLML